MGTKIRRRACWGNRSLVVVVAWVLAVSFGHVALARDGDRDRTFGRDGRVTTPFAGGAFARAVAIHPDGKIVAVGAAAGRSGRGEFALARYDPGGTLDPTFGHNGRVTTAIGAGGDEGRSVAIQPDGKIVVAGTAGGGFAVARYDPDGTLDTTFGANGIVTTDITPGDDIAYDMAIQPDGRIVAVGRAGVGFRPTFALARYDVDGTLDPTFGGDGTVTSIVGVARALVLQPNGRIVVAGYHAAGLALARYRKNGSLDASFGHGGKVGRSFPQAFVLAVTLQPDGKIVVGGDADIFRFSLARFTADGRLDRTFGGDGRVTTSVGPGEQGVVGLVIQHSGRIVAAGHAGPHEFGDNVVWRFVLTRYRANGVRDRSFGTDGKVVTRFRGGAFAAGSAIQPGGKIVVVGGVGESNAQGFALARYRV